VLKEKGCASTLAGATCGSDFCDSARSTGRRSFHCIRGHDRTGIIALLLLALVGVTPDEIIADYELSPDPERDELLARETAYMS
jgi:hypothetical protein